MRISQFLFPEDHLFKQDVFVTSLTIIIFHFIILFGIGPFAFNIYFVNDSALDTMIAEYRAFGKWNLPTPDIKLLFFRITVYFILFIMFLHAYTSFLMLIVYIDSANRLLRSIYTITLQMSAARITSKQVVNSMLTNICRMYIEQKVLNIFAWDMLQTFSLMYITLLVPFLMVSIYVCIRFSELIVWPLYIISVFTTGFLVVGLVFIHIHASCLQKQSCRFLESCRTKIIPVNTRHLYWRMKFRSLREIRVGAFWWHFSRTNLLPLGSYILTVSTNLLLL